jgi:prepilin-type N-terminal cleavage/methylation domain-containing protein
MTNVSSPRPSGASRDRRAGFTLFETIITLLLIGILLAGGAISLQGAIPKYRLRSAARGLATTIEHTRLAAVSRGAWMGIHYVITPGTRDASTVPYYQVIPPPPEDNPYQAPEDRELLSKQEIPQGVRIGRVILGGNQSVDRGTLNILFSPMGNSGSHIVVLEDDGGRILSVKLNAITGLIDFVEGPPVEFARLQE